MLRGGGLFQNAESAAIQSVKQTFSTPVELFSQYPTLLSYFTDLKTYLEEIIDAPSGDKPITRKPTPPCSLLDPYKTVIAKLDTLVKDDMTTGIDVNVQDKINRDILDVTNDILNTYYLDKLIREISAYKLVYDRSDLQDASLMNDYMKDLVTTLDKKPRISKDLRNNQRQHLLILTQILEGAYSTHNDSLLKGVKKQLIDEKLIPEPSVLGKLLPFSGGRRKTRRRKGIRRATRKA
jgi:hypothetical protein